MKISETCIKETKDKIIICEEHKRKIVFINKQKKNVKKILVDGCQITEGIRCDYLVVYDKCQNFIELKGKKIEHAFKQLKNTIIILGKNDCNKNSFVISSRCPLSSPKIQNQKLIFKRDFKSSLIIKNNKFEKVI